MHARTNILSYPLPENRIAKYPSPERDKSKLLVYKHGDIIEDKFLNIEDYLPANSHLVFNDSKVIQARFLFYKDTGARIEIFCLSSYPEGDFIQSFSQTGEVEWKCLVGNRKKWKGGRLVKEGTKAQRHKGTKEDVGAILCDCPPEICDCPPLICDCPPEMETTKNNEEILTLTIEQKHEVDGGVIIKFSWNDDSLCFAEIFEIFGETPLPPYIVRAAEKDDKQRYQTIYAANTGSVAAPTAGLHFTDNVMEKLSMKDVGFSYLSLHVGAGTFKPISSDDISEHVMHREYFCVRKTVIIDLLEKYRSGKVVVGVGTTSVRTLESLFLYGASLLNGGRVECMVGQKDGFNPAYKSISVEASFQAILDRNSDVEEIKGQTQLMIMPGYEYKTIQGLITNFHQPKSTLLLLVSAFIGEDWQKVYDYALENDFRFLSYGDSCLLLAD